MFLLRILFVLICAAVPLCAAAGTKTLRVSSLNDVASFDPARVSDLYTATVAGNVLESLYTYAYLARPLQVKPQTAAALPEVADNFRQFTIRVRPGIYFADDPAFRGQRRELIAQDYVYSFKRNFDPRLRSPHYPTLSDLQVLGIEPLRERASQPGQAFDYDTPIEGLQALDRYTLRFRLNKPAPRFVYALAAALPAMAVAREVVEAYGEQVGEHPVGTGPFRLVQWRRGSLLVLERNPGYREEHYDETPPAQETRSVAAAAALKGRRLPMVDRVEVAVIEEDQPRWLAFLRGDYDISSLPYPFVPVALPGGHVAPSLAQRGIEAHLVIRPDLVFTYFNMQDPVVGGYTPQQVALRRAIGLGYDNQEEIRVIRRQLAAPAQSVVPPQTYGYDPTLKSEMSDYSPARANALLDVYGFVDRDGDGWRDRPDGRPLLLLKFHTDKTLREFNELWKRRMDALHLRIEFVAGQWTEQQKAARAGQLMMWGLAWNASSPDGADFLRLAYGPAKGAENLSRFDLPAYNQLFDKLDALPDGPERLRLIGEANRLLLAYMPFKAHVHRVGVDMAHPWVIGLLPNPFLRSFWNYIDVDDTLRSQAR